jgi:hypothetical protein
MGKWTTSMSLVLAASTWGTPSHAGAAGKHQTVVFRNDLPAKLGRILCEDRKALSTELSWKYGLNDAQLEGRFFLPRAGVKATIQEMSKRGKSLAKRMHHHGFAGGVCPDGSGWAISVPAPIEMKPAQNGGLTLPMAELTDHCSDVAVDFAPSGRGLGKVLNTVPTTISLRSLGQGTLSVSCLPRTPAWQGTVMWYLQPVNTTAVTEIPGKPILDGSDAPELVLARWINELRKNEKLPPIIFGALPMAEAANLLSIGGGIIHNRKLLKNAKDLLAGRKFTLIGEDRVKAESIPSLAWHLWNSPRHRRLLLDNKATHLGISLQKQYDGFFAVIATGAGDIATVSENPVNKSSL